MTSGGKRYPEKADRGTDRTGGCPRDLIARVSLMPMSAANATVPLPLVQAPECEPVEPHRHAAGDPADDRGGEQPYRLRWVQPPRHAAVVGVQQHQGGHPIRMVEGPVDHGWTGGVVRHENHTGEDALRPVLHRALNAAGPRGR